MNNRVTIRPETLRPARKWEKPTPDEIRELIRLTGMNSEDVAAILGLAPPSKKSGRGSRTVRRWKSGDVQIPYAAWALLAHQAGFGTIWVDCDEDERHIPKMRGSHSGPHLISP
ncbi:MAG TPA: transcriptional regulator [Halothiobacillus sp.]|nr:transcriptional regulator [Halothiobacillus sp.]